MRSLPAHLRDRSFQAATSEARNSNTHRPAEAGKGCRTSPARATPRKLTSNSLQRKRTHGPSMRFGGRAEQHPWPIHAVPAASMGHRCGSVPPGNRIGGTSLRESAGINRHGGGDGRALRRRASDPRRPSAMRRRPARAWRSVSHGHVQAGLLSREIILPGCPRCPQGGRQYRWRRYREPSGGPARSEIHGMCGTFMRENREIPCLARPG